MGKDIKNTTPSVTRRLGDVTEAIIVTYFAFNVWPIGVFVGGAGTSFIFGGVIGAFLGLACGGAIGGDEYSVIIGATVGAVIGGSVAAMLFSKLKNKGNAKTASAQNGDSSSNTVNNRYYTKFK
ncbi:MAG: hypothetical protein FWF23_01950 [Alphaproteobacteria bacterium]|nr:hypothetical protein [Alphaproteobacteria bacterium]MCL2505671.1 hypothetical protein [Alphaproteobacteria bacterium]